MPSEDYIKGVKDTIKKLYLVTSKICQNILDSIVNEPETLEEVLKEK